VLAPSVRADALDPLCATDDARSGLRLRFGELDGALTPAC